MNTIAIIHASFFRIISAVILLFFIGFFAWVYYIANTRHSGSTVVKSSEIMQLRYQAEHGSRSALEN